MGRGGRTNAPPGPGWSPPRPGVARGHRDACRGRSCPPPCGACRRPDHHRSGGPPGARAHRPATRTAERPGTGLRAALVPRGPDGPRTPAAEPHRVAVLTPRVVASRGPAAAPYWAAWGARAPAARRRAGTAPASPLRPTLAALPPAPVRHPQGTPRRLRDPRRAHGPHRDAPDTRTPPGAPLAGSRAPGRPSWALEEALGRPAGRHRAAHGDGPGRGPHHAYGPGRGRTTATGRAPRLATRGPARTRSVPARASRAGTGWVTSCGGGRPCSPCGARRGSCHPTRSGGRGACRRW